MRLYDIAKVARSKNAGPFTLTIDLMFDDRRTFDTVLADSEFTPRRIAGMYHVDEGDVKITSFEAILTIKVSMPRPGASSGAVGDRDVYGSQQHFPLADLEIATPTGRGGA